MSRLLSVGGLQANPQTHLQGKDTCRHGGEVIGSAPRKPLSTSLARTVPQTDTGGRAEYAQALERTREKELGKLTP